MYLFLYVSFEHLLCFDSIAQFAIAYSFLYYVVANDKIIVCFFKILLSYYGSCAAIFLSL